MTSTSGDATIEREITDQVVALRARLHSTVKKRREIEARIRKLRSKLRAEEARLESEEEREEALKTALKMAELALNLASGKGSAGDLSTLDSLNEETDWEDMTIAQACQQILQENYNRPMTNRELQASLQAKGKDVPLGSIPTTLERYREQFRKEKRGHVTYWSLHSDEPQPIEAED